MDLQQQFEEWFLREMDIDVSSMRNVDPDTCAEWPYNSGAESSSLVITVAFKAWMANREAQPVAWHFPGSETESAQLGYDHELDDEQKRNCVALYTAPPAPAAPEKCPEHVRSLMNIHADDLFDDADAQEIWNACRAAMLAAAPEAAK